MKPTKQVKEWYAYIATKGGKAVSEKKAKAARLNGLKGGAPKGNQNWKGKNRGDQ